MTPIEIIDALNELYPDAHCELVHRNHYEMAVAVVLSAQTTDASVNRVTPALFAAYPDAKSLAQADVKEIENAIRSLGLYRNKAKAIHDMAVGMVDDFGGEVPHTMKELTSLPGVGRKCANVILAECYNIPSLAVDTHVNRISKRLGLAKPDDTLLQVETKLKRKIPRERWIKCHHQMIFFGRYRCKSRNPECNGCPFWDICNYRKGKVK